MGRFQSMVNEGEGFARRARFYVEFFMPRGLDFGGGIGAEDTAVRVKGTGEGIEAFTMGSELRAVHNANGRRVRGFCSEISMPNRDTTIKEDVSSIKKLAEERYEVSSKKYYEPVWFEIRKDDYLQDSNMWQSQLDYLGIEADCNVVTLKVVAYVEHDPLYDAPCS